MSDAVRFLLVDDVEDNLLALDGLLRQDGLEILKARSADAALELLLVHDFALALVDVQMPGMSGFELAELMRGTSRTRRVPIILMTAGGSDEGRRFKGYEAGAVDYLVKPIDAHILQRKAEVFFQLDRQRRDLIRQRDEIEASEQRFRRSLILAPTPVMLFDEGGQVITVNAEWTASTGHDGRCPGNVAEWALQACGAQADDLLRRIWRLVHGAEERVRIDLEARAADGTLRSWDVVVSPVGPGADGRMLFVFLAHDITERVQAERTRQLLVGELNHRVKNNLATVIAIARQTLRQTRDPDQFAASFMGRIMALSRAHSLLSDETWQGADLGDLLRDQLSLGSVEEQRVLRAGPAVRLTPQIALHAAMMLHELFTNATKYGALSTPDGRVMVSWMAMDGQLRLSWAERDGPPVRPPSRRGFGSALIERSAKACGGHATARFDADGVTWDLALPAGDADASPEAWWEGRRLDAAAK